MKKIISLALCLCMICSMVVCASAGEEDCVPYAVEGGSIYFNSTTGTVENSDSTITRAVIPETINGVTVTAIAGGFSQRPDLTEVVFPNTVTTISGSFLFCEKLEKVTLPSGLTELPQGLFSYCKALKALNIPDTVVTIGRDCFFNCTALEEITLPDGLLEIPANCFDYCSSLERVHFGKNILKIGESAFRYCNSLDEVVLQSPVESIGDNAFQECQFLTKADLGTGALTIGERAFHNTPLLQELTLSPATVAIGDSAFMLSDIRALEVPAGCTLGKGAFSNNENLKKIVIGEGMETLLDSTFSGCSRLESVVLPASIKYIQERAFMNCFALRSIGFLGNCPDIDGRAFQITAEWPKNPQPSHALFYKLEDATGFESFMKPSRLYAWDGKTLPILPLPPFVDIVEEDWFYTAVCKAYGDALMNGVSEKTFEPNSPMTRAMLVTVLWRYAGQKEEGTNTFTDVPAGQWYTKAVAWAAKNGVVNGTSDTTFSPDDNISREQMATILYRYAKSIGLDVSKQKALTSFPDASQVSNYAREALSWCVAEGIIGGSDGYLLPQGNATRAQVAAILMRFLENVVS